MSTKKAIILLTLTCIIWGTTFTVIKDITYKIDPFLLSSLRNWIASVVLFLYILIKNKKDALKNQQSIKYGIILGVIIGAIYIIQTIGLKITSSTHSAFISSSGVIMVPIILFLFGKNKIEKNQLITVGIVMVGIYLLTNGNDNNPYNFGDTITLVGAIVCAINIILAGEYAKKTEQIIGLIFYQFLFAAVFSTIALVINQLISGEKLVFEIEAIPSVLYLSLLGTLFCYFVMTWVQKYVSTLLTAMIYSLEPIFATTASILYLHEKITYIEVIGGILIVSGVIFYTKKGELN